MANDVSAIERKAIPHANKSNQNKSLNRNGSITPRNEIPHVNKSTKNKAFNLNGGSKKTISNALKRRAQAVINDKSIDAQTRAIIRYGLETNDPWLPDLVRRVDAGETIIETIVVLKRPKLTPGFGTGEDRSVDSTNTL